jgi:YfiH family protein
VIQRRREGRLLFYAFPHLEDAGARNLIATRLGGGSEGPYAALNVSYSVGDDPIAVEANRRTFFAAAATDADHVVTCYQVHSTNVTCVGMDAGGCGALAPANTVAEADALITDVPDLHLFLRFADCVPILLCDPRHGAVGLAHAGWKGTVGDMAGAVVAAMVDAFESRPVELLAAVGPSIGPCHYQIRQDVATLVRQSLPFWRDVLHEDGGALWLDLPEANRRQLLARGLVERNVVTSGICTACHTDEFYSHRAEHGKTGRFGVLIGWSGNGSGHG